MNEQTQDVRIALDKLCNKLIEDNERLKDEVKALKQKNNKLQKTLDQAYTLASRHYKNGLMTEMEKLLDESEDEG